MAVRTRIIAGEQEIGTVKTHWSEDERSPLKVFGNLSEKAKQTLTNPSEILVLQGEFGVGKSSLTHLLLGLGRFLLCPKGMSTAFHPSLDQRDQHCYKTWLQTRNAVLETSLVGMSPPYPEWNYWGGKLNVVPPTRDELIVTFDDLIASFWIEDVTKVMRIAFNVEMVLVFELSLTHTRQLINWIASYAGMENVLRKTTVVRVKAPTEVRTGRIDKRYTEHPSARGSVYDDIIRRARILEGASMPQRLSVPTPYQVHEIDNGTTKTQAELCTTAQKIVEIVEEHAAGR